MYSGHDGYGRPRDLHRIMRKQGLRGQRDDENETRGVWWQVEPKDPLGVRGARRRDLERGEVVVRV